MVEISRRPVVLVLDDEEGIRVQARRILTETGFDVEGCASYDDAVKLLEKHEFDAFVVDLNLLGEKSGIDFLQTALEKQPRVPFAIVSECLNDTWGARLSRFFVERGKPLDIQLEKTGFEVSLQEWANALLVFLRDKCLARRDTYHSEDVRVKRLVSEILPIVAASEAPVLIVGESGTGKEDLARLIHENSENPFRSGPFVAVNCAAISDTLILSELFGHVKNSFTGAEEHRLGWFLEASGWKHEPPSARKARRLVVDEILKTFGVEDINDLYKKVIMGGDFRAQKAEIDGFMTEINKLVKKLRVLDGYLRTGMMLDTPERQWETWVTRSSSWVLLTRRQMKSLLSTCMF